MDHSVWHKVHCFFMYFGGSGRCELHFTSDSQWPRSCQAFRWACSSIDYMTSEREESGDSDRCIFEHLDPLGQEAHFPDASDVA